MSKELSIRKTVVLRPSYVTLAAKLAVYHGLRGRGKLFEKYLREDMERLKSMEESERIAKAAGSTTDKV